MNMSFVHVVLKRVCSLTLALIPLVAVAGPPYQPNAEADRPRVVITADPELDDNNTIIRAILYSSDVRLEGLIYVSSQFHWRGDGRGTTSTLPAASTRALAFALVPHGVSHRTSVLLTTSLMRMRRYIRI